jgi:glucokinase
MMDSTRSSPSPPSAILVGVDLGATMVRAGAFSPEGEMLAVNQTEIQAQLGPEHGFQRICGLIEQLLAQEALRGAPLLGVGVGSTGPVDALSGVFVNPGTLPGWDGVPLVAWLEERFAVPAFLDNDAAAAALGEYWMGAGRGVSRLYAVTLGTGIGTSCVIDGQTYRGAGGFHPEGGHQIIDPAGPQCYCGAQGCWESLASGTAIARDARQALAKNPASRLLHLAGGDPERVDARLVAEAALQGDALAQAIIDRAAEYFALGLFNLLMLFFPEVIVLSGGVMRSSQLFMPAIQRAVQKATPYLPTHQVEIRLAKLGYYAGIYGAAYAISRRVV